MVDHSPVPDTFKPRDRSGLIVLGLFAAVIVAGPAIFYGLLAAGNAGWLDFIAANVWVLVPILLAVVAIIWLPILWLGARLDRPHLDNSANAVEAHNG